jgi:hypothetical protein
MPLLVFFIFTFFLLTTHRPTPGYIVQQCVVCYTPMKEEISREASRQGEGNCIDLKK